MRSVPSSTSASAMIWRTVFGMASRPSSPMPMTWILGGMGLRSGGRDWEVECNIAKSAPIAQCLSVGGNAEFIADNALPR